MSHIITLNAGSSSVKFALFEVEGRSPRLVASGLAETQGEGCRFRARDGAGALSREAEWTPAKASAFHAEALDRILEWREDLYPAARIMAAGHRVVHGGVKYAAPAVIDAQVMADLEALIPLAPLHEPANIEGVKAAQAAWPDVPQVACFDTAFHRGQDFVHQTFALPRSFFDEGVRRYGFHGLSYEYIAGALAELDPAAAQGRVVVAHLGNGASLCAMRGGRSVATSMGFTALDGLPMGTRCGQIDPGVVLYLIEQKGLSPHAVSDLLYKEAGLKGLSGLSSDMRALEAAGTPQAEGAIAYFVNRVRREMAAMAAELDGVDAVVFCGGIGEHAVKIRRSILAKAQWMGIVLDAAANSESRLQITTPQSPVRVYVIPTNEEAMIARHTLNLTEIVGELPNRTVSVTN
jgi:acetate kinase